VKNEVEKSEKDGVNIDLDCEEETWEIRRGPFLPEDGVEKKSSQRKKRIGKL